VEGHRWRGEHKAATSNGTTSGTCYRTGQNAGVGRPEDTRLSFNEAAETYDEVRPSYPADLFDSLFDLLPLEPEIVEVGPGTGQATKDLLARGASVHAIEVGPAMAAKLRSNLPTNRLRVSIDDFEALNIATASADAVFSATAYHWITPAAQTDRPASILRPSGVIAIVDLIQVDSPSDLGFFAEAQPIYERYGEGHTGLPAPTRDFVDPAIRSTLEADGRFDHVTVRRYVWDQTYSASAYRKQMLSYSGTQMMDEDDRAGLLDDMESFIRRDFAGQITRPLVVTLTTAVLA
jgi:trans-aconitate methyltransferase